MVTPRPSTRTPKNIGSSIATARTKQRDNNERIQDGSVSGTAENPGDWNRQTKMGNTPLKITTCTTTPEYGALHYDDVMETGTKYLVPDDFQYTTNKSDRIPSWSAMSTSIDAPDAVTRTETGGQGHPGYHKAPAMKQYSPADCAAISKGQVTSVSQLQGRTDPVSTYKSGTIGKGPGEKYGSRRSPNA